MKGATHSYGKLCTEFYDLDKPQAPPDAFAFYERFAKLAKGPILEPMCGSGRFLLPLLERGLDIEGTDTSPSMLAACRAHASARGLSPVLHEQSLQRLELSRQFGLVFICSGSFCLITEPGEVKDCLARIFAAMLPGGTFLVEAERLVASEPAMSGTWGGRWVERPDGARLVISWLSQFSGAPNVSHSVHRYELVKAGKLLETEYEDFKLRCYEPAEFRGLLERAGFREIEELKPFELAPADASDEASIFACKKP